MSSSEPSSSVVRVRIRAASEMTEIRVSDAHFKRISLPGNVGTVDVDLPEGIYEVAFREGTSWNRQLAVVRPSRGGLLEVREDGSGELVGSALLDPDGTVAIRQGVSGHVRGAAPVDEDESDPAAAFDIANSTAADASSECTVRLVVRNIHEPGDFPDSSPAQWLAGLSLVTEQGSPVPGTDMTATNSQAAMHTYRVPPGCWRVRLTTGLGDQSIEMSLIVCPGWDTRAYFPVRRYGRDNWRADLCGAVICMREPGVDAPFLRRAEANALQSLATGRRLHGRRFNEMLRELLHGKFRNPMFGLYGGHLLACNDAEEVALLKELVDNLSALVSGGPRGAAEATDRFVHPDVEALRCRLHLLQQKDGGSVEPIAKFPFPPMLKASWSVVLKLAGHDARVVPEGSLADLVAGRLWGSGAWMIWSTPPETERPEKAPAIEEPAIREVSRHALAVDAVSRDTSTLDIARASPAAPYSSLQGDRGRAPESIEESCKIIAAALSHKALRGWFREATTVKPAERQLAQAIHPMADGEEHQLAIDRLRLFTARPGRKGDSWSAERLARELYVPLSTVERTAKNLSVKLLVEGLRLQLDLKARSHMAVPELIIPYDSGFLGDDFVVPLPDLTPTLAAAALFDGAVVDYTHFSLVMHANRRIAAYTAANIDASRIVRVSRGVPWKMDERVGEFQLGPEAYADNQLDRGHLVRRKDVVWGSVTEAKLANAATFFYTNAAPQHQNFNQDEWVTLEDWVLNQATDFSYRLCVFTGPVLRSDDPVLNDLPPNLRTAFRAVGPAQIPAAFWKVVVLRDGAAGGEDLSVVCFAMRQSEMWNDKEGKRLLSLKVHQVTLQAIEQWTGLDFGNLRFADELEWSELRQRMTPAESPAWPLIRDASDIILSGASRRARGARVPRAANVAGSAGRRTADSRTVGRLRPGRDSGLKLACDCTDGPFDAKEAIASLGRDLARLADAIATQSAPLPAPVGGARAAVPQVSSATETPDVAERVDALVSRAPIAAQERMRDFARGIIVQADVARGRLPVSTPTELQRIVGGDSVPPGGFPSCCCIGDATSWFCTGVLVRPNVVLTAAHCGAGITRVMAGGNRVTPWVDPAARVLAVRQVRVHPQYRGHPYNENDITVLILDQPAPFPPVPVPTAEDLREARQVELVGFGYNDPERPLGFGTKRRVMVALGPIRLAAGEDWSQLESYLGFHADYELVAGRKGLGRDTCNGDSGGPAYFETTDGLLVAGLTSRATHEAVVNCGDGGIYVRPDCFRGWINEVLNGAGIEPI